MMEVLYESEDAGWKYQSVRTERGVLVTSHRMAAGAAPPGPTEWLYATEEAASKGLNTVMLFNQLQIAMSKGYPTAEILEHIEQANIEYREAVARLGDEPLVGDDVKRLVQSLARELP